MNNNSGLRRELTLFDAIAVIIGIMIGSGIFFIPTFVFNRAGSVGMALMVWIAAGVISTLSGLCYAELGAAMPKAGGPYNYLREAYGPVWAFLRGWTGFLIGGPGSIAALAVAFATYTSYFIPLQGGALKLVAVLAIAFLTFVNILGVRQGAMVQRVFTVAKVIPIIAIIVYGIVTGTTGEPGSLLSFAGSGGLAAFGLALIAALWAYEGWANVTSLAEELKNPQRNLPLAMILGVGGVTVLYLLFNVALLRIMPVADIMTTSKPAAEAATVLFGHIGGVIITGGALISIFGSTNGCILAFPRNYLAMSRDGLFFSALADVHPRFGTPVKSLIVSGLLSCVLVASGTFSQLTTLVVFSGMIFSTMVVASVFILRRKYPDMHRPYKVIGYPVVPLVVLALNLFLLLNSLIEDPSSSILGLVVALLGVPVYYWFDRRRMTAGITAVANAPADN